MADFATGLRGPLLRPGDDGYDAARQVWNGMIDRRPALIARCAGPADVIAAVRFARTHRLLLAVQRRRPQHHRQRRVRGRADDRPVADEERKGRSAGAHRAGRGGPDLGRIQPRDAGLRPRQHRRRGFDHRHRRADPGWRTRLVDGEAWPQLRQPAVGRHRHRRRRVADRQRGARTRTCSGACAAAAAISAW